MPYSIIGLSLSRRRKFVEIIKVTHAKEGVAHDILLFIAKLAHIAVQPRTLPKSPLGQAVSYTLNQWPKLLTYLKERKDILNPIDIYYI